jgi:hypothetical protein
VRPAPSPSRQYARLRDMMVDACMLTTTTRKRAPVAGRPRYLLSHKPPYTFHRIALLWSNRAGVWQNVVDLA